MGIRINKEVGFFISNENIDKVFDSRKLLEILEDETIFPFNTFAQSMLDFDSSALNNLVVSSYQSQDLPINDFISVVYNGYDSVGILFKPKSLHSINRYNNFMDYAEHMKQYGIPTFIIQNLNFNPSNYGFTTYIYKGDKTSENLTYGKESTNISDILILYPEYRSQNDPIQKLIDNHIITVKIDCEIFAIAQLTKSVLTDVDIYKFNHFFQPVIITNWC